MLYDYQLSYKPYRGSFAITHHRHHLYIVDYNRASLHVHDSENGEHVGQINMEQLGCQEGERIYQVCCGEGGVMHVMIADEGTSPNKYYLRCFRIS